MVKAAPADRLIAVGQDEWPRVVGHCGNPRRTMKGERARGVSRWRSIYIDKQGGYYL